MVDWNARYVENDTPWDRGQPSPALLRWVEDLKPCRIVVPGCGRGHEVVALARRGFDVIGVDTAYTALNQLADQMFDEQLKGLLVEGNVLEWTPEKPVEAVYEQTCFCALEPEHWERYCEQLHRWLAPGGLLKACFMQTGSEGGPPYHCSLEEMKKLFSEDKWQWPKEQAEKIPHPRGDIFELAVELKRVG